jgi:cytochrome c peroxidase
MAEGRAAGLDQQALLPSPWPVTSSGEAGFEWDGLPLLPVSTSAREQAVISPADSRSAGSQRFKIVFQAGFAKIQAPVSQSKIARNISDFKNFMKSFLVKGQSLGAPFVKTLFRGFPGGRAGWLRGGQCDALKLQYY